MRKKDGSVQTLYRVVCRRKGSEDPWKIVGGYDRTYVTIGAARGIRTRCENEHASGYMYAPDRETFEFAVQSAPVGDWELV